MTLAMLRIAAAGAIITPAGCHDAIERRLRQRHIDVIAAIERGTPPATIESELSARLIPRVPLWEGVVWGSASRPPYGLRHAIATMLAT